MGILGNPSNRAHIIRGEMTEPVAVKSVRRGPPAISKGVWTDVEMYSSEPVIKDGKPVLDAHGEVVTDSVLLRGRMYISRPASGAWDEAQRKIATNKPDGNKAFVHQTKLEFIAAHVLKVDRASWPGFPDGEVKAAVLDYFALPDDYDPKGDDEPSAMLWVEQLYNAVGLVGAPRVYFC